MNDSEIIKVIESVGFSDKAAKIYVAILKNGESTVQDIAKFSHLKRTSVYYVLDELKTIGVLVQIKNKRKTFYNVLPPREVLSIVRDRVQEFEESIFDIEEIHLSIYPKPKIYFLYGPQGFKHIWEMIFETKEKEFSLITEGFNFLDFVKEKYILDEIIEKKKKFKIFSRQLIVNSDYAQDVIKKDKTENRVSKVLPPRTRLPYTEVITKEFVAFISPRWDNTLFVVENRNFAKSRLSLFDIIWSILPEEKN